MDADAAGTLFVVVDRPATLVGVDALCARVHMEITNTGTRSVVCDVTGLRDADEVALETVARLQLTAKRARVSLRLIGVGRRLADLLDAAGLTEIVPASGSGFEVARHAEQREQLGIDEEVDAGDLGV